jgi:hypothetical protein
VYLVVGRSTILQILAAGWVAPAFHLPGLDTDLSLPCFTRLRGMTRPSGSVRPRPAVAPADYG